MWRGEATTISDHRQRCIDARAAPKTLTDGLDTDCYVEEKRGIENVSVTNWVPLRPKSLLHCLPYSVKIKTNPLNILPMPDATMLSFVWRGTGKDTAWATDFSFCSQCSFWQDKESIEDKYRTSTWYPMEPWLTDFKRLWRKKWQPALVCLNWKSHGQRALAALVHGIAKESNVT